MRLQKGLILICMFLRGFLIIFFLGFLGMGIPDHSNALQEIRLYYKRRQKNVLPAWRALQYLLAREDLIRSFKKAFRDCRVAFKKTEWWLLDFYNKGGGAGIGLEVPNQTLDSSPIRSFG